MVRKLRDESGYVLVFGLLVIPVFLTFGLLIIDLGRGNNAHADLQAAADAVALAGARELDGGVDAITRAQAAMDNFQNSVSMLGMAAPDMHIPLVYSPSPGNEFYVEFLEDIPNFDTTPITAAWITANRTSSGPDAAFVYVRAQSRDLQTAFFNPLTMLREQVPVAAIAVATYTSAVCDIPPLYVCNPFEFITDPVTGQPVYDGNNLQTRFQNGDLHGRLMRMHPPGASTNAPGNFGYLDIGNGANALKDYFAGSNSDLCYEADSVDTQTGAANSVFDAINTRLDMYQQGFANFNNLSYTPVPAGNVRKGMLPHVGPPNNTIDDCMPNGNNPNASRIVDDHIIDPATGNFNKDGIVEGVYGLPDNFVMLAPNQGVPGASIGQDHTWPISTYLNTNYGMNYDPNNPPMGLTSSFAGKTPSRYDVYQWEIANAASLNQNRAPGAMVGGSDTGEMGYPMCASSAGTAPDPTEPDRRVIIAAIIDCVSNSPNWNGSVDNLPVNSYGSFFLARPGVKYWTNDNEMIDLEIIDITGFGGNGTLDIFVREEALLVR